MADQDQTTDIRPEEREIETGWKDAPKLADLKLDYTGALNHHNNHTTAVGTWLDNLNVTGAAKPAFRKGRSQVVPKLIRKQAEWRYAGLSESFLAHENLFTTEPVTFEDKEAAIQNGLILNNQWNTQLDKVSFIDNFVRTGVDEGTIIVKVGWDFHEEEIDVPNLIPRPISDPFKKKLVEQGASMLMQDPEQAAANLPSELLETVRLSLEIGQLVELVIDPRQASRKQKVVTKNQPTAEVCDYMSTMIDPTCKGIIDRAQFVVYQFKTSKGELKKDGRYVNLDKISIEQNAQAKVEGTNPQEEDIGSFNFMDESRKKFDAYEYWGFWDIDKTGIPQSFLATWVGDTLIRMERSPFPDNKLPFVLVPYLPKRRSVYGEPDGALLEDNQKIAGAVTRGMIDIMGRSAAGQVGYRKDALDVTNLRKFERGDDYSFNANVDPRVAFHSNVYPEIPQSAQYMLNLQYNEAESITGVKAFHEGITGEGLGRSATAARSAIDAAGKRELGILRRLSKAMTEIGRKIIAMNAVFLSEEEIVRVTNEKFVTINREDLDGRINVKLKISTPEADDAKAQELAFMLQTVGNNLPANFSLMIMEEIARLRKMPELAKRIEEYQPEPDPRAERLAELEIEKAEAEIEKLRSEAAENYAEAELDLASAKLAGSKADNEDLNFVEGESGVTQERAKELQGVQAEGNIRLEREKRKNSTNGDNGNKASTPT